MAEDAKQDVEKLALVPYMDKSAAASPHKAHSNQSKKRLLAKASFDLGPSDLQTLAFALEQKAPAEKQHETTPKKGKGKTKPNSPKKSPIMQTFKKQHSNRMLKHRSTTDAKTKDEKDAKGCQEPNKHGKEGGKVATHTCKSSFKHRKTSTAYHSARAASIKAGDSPNTSKIKAKQASHKVAALIDAGVLKEQ